MIIYCVFALALDQHCEGPVQSFGFSRSQWDGMVQKEMPGIGQMGNSGACALLGSKELPPDRTWPVAGERRGHVLGSENCLAGVGSKEESVSLCTPGLMVEL